MAARLRKARPPRDPEAIPLELRSIPRWLLWDFFPPKNEGAKPLKVPVKPGGDYQVSAHDPANWQPFEAALEEARRRSLGVGFAFSDSDDLIGVDLDDAYLPSGELKPWAKEIVERFGGTWGEKSPSGRGVHLIGRGPRVSDEHKAAIEGGDGAVERYSSGQYFTVSGDVIQAAPLGDIREAMEWLAARHFRPAALDRAKAIREANRDAAGPSHYAPDPELDREVARVCVSHLAAWRAAEWEAWYRVGMALKAVSEDLLDEWVGFSKGWEGWKEDKECREMWRDFKPRRIGLGSLVHWASQDSQKNAVDFHREAKTRLGRPAVSATSKKTVEEIDRDDRIEAARYGVDLSGVLCLVLASDRELSLYREIGLGLAGDLVAVPELTRQDWARIAKAFPGVCVQLIAGDLGDDSFRNSCRSLLGTKAAPEAVVVIGPEAWEGRDDLPSWADDNGLPDAAGVLVSKSRPAALWVADDVLRTVSPASSDTARREAVDRVLDAVAECRGPRAALDVEDLLCRAEEATGYSREALEALISKARERAEERRIRERLGKDLSALATTAGEGKVDSAELIDQARAALDEIEARSAVVPLPPIFDVAAIEAEARLVKPGFSTGWRELDEARVRLRPKELVGVAARPGQGKTSVLVWLAWKLLEQASEGAVVFVSHEETKVSILYRLFALAAAELVPDETMLSSYSDSRRWNRGDVRDWLADGGEKRFSKEKIELLTRARELVIERARRLVVIEERGAGADRVAKLCRAVHDAHGVAGVALDYLQRLPHDGPDLAKGRRDMETAWACRRLREGIALPFDCPVVIAAQVNREALRDGWGRRLLEALDPSKKKKSSKRSLYDDGGDDSIEERIRRVERVLAEARPAPHHLRDGGIEHEADLILGVHSPAADMAWDKEKRRDFVDMAWRGNETPLDVGILKNRSGADGDWVRLVGDYGASYFTSRPARDEVGDPVGAKPLAEWDPDSNPFA